tara:strand:- start:5151 stop:11543 length:6393 start_codon:yes stop_codon:yes gene_type:complete
MAKKLVYNYTFTPGVANVGNIQISGNYPSKVWQLVTDTGTGGLYPHIFVRDEYANSSSGIYSAAAGAIEIISGGSGDLVMDSGTSFNENTGLLTVVTTTTHGLSTGATVKFRLLGMTFTCAKDNHTTEHSYPRTTDPTYDQALTITVVSGTSFTANVGRSVGGAISSNNEIIYNFADNTKGGSTYYDSNLDKTTLTLKHDTSHLDPLDDLQIFIDIQEDKINFSETFTDPVSKLRVSNPQNLIDTDFEYGLQPTKWETVELVNNVPSFFASNTTYSISDVLSVSTIQNSDNITVTTQEPHGLTVGSPIDVQGLTSRTAEGKFLVTSVPSTTTFVYKAKSPQNLTGTINGSYTVITPGEFYSGSDININDVGGIETDGATKSSLTLTTDYHHGFGRGSSLYFTNTIGLKKFTIDQTSTSTAPDGRPYVDHVDTTTTTVSTTSSLTETKQMTGMYAHKFTSSDVNTSDNTITWTSHALSAGDVLLYIPPSGDTHIGGLQRFQIYYVKSTPTANTITLCETTNGNFSGNSTINFSSAGTSNYGRHQLVFGWEITSANKPTNEYRSYFKTRYNDYSTGSGQDMTSSSYDSISGYSGYWGKAGRKPERYIFVSKSGGNFDDGIIDNSMAIYSTTRNSNFTFGKSGSTPDGYDFIEDIQRFNSTSSFYTYATGTGHWGHYYYSRTDSNGSIGIYYLNWFDYSNSYSETYSLGDRFFFPLKSDPEADTIYSPSHGLAGGTPATITTSSGSDITYRTDSGTTWNTSPSTASLANGASINLLPASSDRLKIVNAQRLVSASGSYSFAASVPSSTANSFYFSGHDLVANQQITLSTTGTLPSSTSGAANPTTNSITTVYNSVNSVLTSMKTTMGSDSTDLLYDSSTRYSPFSARNQSFDGGRQNFYWQEYRTTVYDPNSGQRVYSPYWWTSGINTKPFTGVAWDPFETGTFGGRGYYHIGTPFTYNTTTPYFVSILQTPDISQYGHSRVQHYVDGQWKYHYTNDGVRGNENNTMDTSLGDGWRYTYETNYFEPTANDHGLIMMHLVIDNTGWPGYYNNSNPSIYFWGDRYMYGSQSYYSGQRYDIQMLIPVKAGSTAGNYGASGSVKTHATLAQEVATSIKTALTNPTLSAGLVYANPLNSNRFQLQTSGGTVYNITNSGTSPFTFASEEETGSLDGYYSVDTVTNTSIGNFSKFEIPKRIVSIGNTGVVTVGSNTYINKENYKMKTTQKVVYTESGGNISGLSDNMTYYAISDGPDHFRLASSIEDARTGNAISIGTTNAGNFTFTTPSIAGISAGIGTIGITSTSTKVTGTDTLFKRFLRTGDTFKIKDTSTSPPTYRDFEIASVVDDTELTVTQSPGFDIVGGNYYIDTKINTRPDGAFVHRPFDGGVEIDAGTSPNSSIVRQTRKYFRYQSGKGIQCSVAINFNPSRLANTLVSVANTTLAAQTYDFDVNNNGVGTYNISGDDRDGRVLGENTPITVTKGDTINFVVNASGHPFWIKTTNSTGTSNAAQGVTNNGDDVGTVIWDTTSITPGTYYYNCENHSSMFGIITVEAVPSATTIATATTKYPHGLTRNNKVKVRGSSDPVYNGTFDVQGFDDFSFSYYLPQAPGASIPDGIIEYNIDSWANSAVRCGLFDYQNGMFFEFDGTELYAVRRSSVQQLSGTVSVQNGSNIVTGTDTNLIGQLNVGGYVVIRGGSYRITHLASKTEMHIQPAYRGIDAGGVIATKTIDTRVAQSDWNIDKADGSGPSGFVLDITKIQMAYIDYSWYGAGKIRFGFKDAKGHVKYMHEFLHNNILEEAYMRSGNIPGRYEIQNTSDTLPTYVPSLFHWGTSVIMDGKFDDDKAYLFTASSNSLNFTNGDSNTATTNAQSTLIRQWNWADYQYDWYVRIPFPSTDAGKFSSGVPLYTSGGELTGELVDFITYQGSTVRVHIYVGSSRSYNGGPTIYPSLSSSTVVNIGAPASGGEEVDLQNEIPLISIRLAPSVDNNLTGSLGQREIINRMQLQLKQLGITLSHDCTVDLILNGEISNRSFTNVTTPSLSELVKHAAGDRVIGGTKIYSLRASGGSENAAGTKRLSATTDFDISQITDLGNSILGGDGTYPNGPDILTIAIVPIDTSEINADTPLSVSSRITWTESQA